MISRTLTASPTPYMVVMVMFIAGCRGDRTESSLIRHLLMGYDPDVRPTASYADILQVELGIALNQIIDLDEKNQILYSNIWLRMYWRDNHLVWNESDYKGIHSIHVSVQRIWRPDITLYNDVGETLPEIERYLASVTSDGSVRWLAPAVVKSSCTLNVLYFPWDRQNCPMKWGSWSFDGTHLNLFNRSMSGDSSAFVTNGEWDLVEFPVTRIVDYFTCCPEPYPSLIFEIIIQRKSLYYVTNLLMPCAFITACSLLVFWLPPESGEKVALSVTILLTTTVFLLLVAETMPAQSIVIPLVSQYFLAVLLMLALSTFTTVILLNFHHRGDLGENVPKWMRKLVLDWLAHPVGLRGLVVLHEEQRKKQLDKMAQMKTATKHGVMLSEFSDLRTEVNAYNMDPSDVTLGYRNSLTADKINPAYSSPCGSHLPSPQNGSIRNGKATPAPTLLVNANELDIASINSKRRASDDTRSLLSEHEAGQNNAITKGFKKILDALDVFRYGLVQRQKQERRVTEWMLVSEILDRVFLVLFTIITVVVNLSIMLSHP